MLSAIGKRGRISAWEAEVSDGPFTCPGCKFGAILRKGYVRVAHFAHEPGSDCPYAEYHENESVLHYRAKKEIYDALSTCDAITHLKLERYLGPVRPDISFRFHGIPVAIEMQVSKISLGLIIHRTKEYSRRGMYLLWLSPFDDEAIKNQRLYETHAQERYIHDALTKGKFYYWISGATLRPVHFANANPGPSVDNKVYSDSRQSEGFKISFESPIRRGVRY